MSETILVTGASRGIGRAAALRLARDGFDVALGYRANAAAARAVAAEIEDLGQTARLLAFDIADRGAARDAIETDIAAHGAYFGVVANAGVTRDAAFPALADDDWDQVIHTNLDGFYNVVKPAVMPMIQRRRPGRIVVLGSTAGLIGNRGQTHYSAAKAGLAGAAKALAVELGKRRITVNCVAPGLIDTDMVDAEAARELVAYVPLARLGQPEEVAATISFLCSEDAAYITRQVISVNGGLC